MDPQPPAPGPAGTIFDRNGDELALSVPGSTIAVNPRQVLDGAGTIDALGNLLNLTDDRRHELLTEMQTCDCGFLYVARQADPRIGRQISDLGLVGVSVYDEDRRMMPGGSTGRSVIGKTDIDGIGTAGLERQYHALLQGSPGEMTLEVAPNGRAIAGTGRWCNRRHPDPTSSPRSTARCSTRPNRCSFARSESPGPSVARSS